MRSTTACCSLLGAGLLAFATPLASAYPANTSGLPQEPVDLDYDDEICGEGEQREWSTYTRSFRFYCCVPRRAGRVGVCRLPSRLFLIQGADYRRATRA